MSKKTFLLRVVRRLVFIGRKGLHKLYQAASDTEHRLSAVIEGRPVVAGDKSVTRARQFAEVYYSANPSVTPVMPALPQAGRRPAVVVLVPTLSDSSLFGGIATALIFGALLSQKTSRGLRIVQTVVNSKATRLQGLFDKYNISIDASAIEVLSVAERRHNYYGYLDLHPADQLVVSAWWDAALAAEFPLRRKFIYLVQDYEPIFYANSDARLLAEQSYQSSNFVAVCNTELMAQCITESGMLSPDTPVLHFEPAVARMAGRRSPGSPGKAKRTLFFYGRPNVERNLFHFGLRILNEVFARNLLSGAEWDVVMAGETTAPNIQLESGVVIRNLGKLSLDEYDEVKLKADVALSLMMAPHPSYPPLELALAGAAVVTSRYGPKQDLTRYSENILCVAPNLESMIDAIVHAAQMTEAERVRNAARTVLPVDWQSAFAQCLDQLDPLLEGKSLALPAAKAESPIAATPTL
ncbi:glycosyltransferase family 4 protein [Cupriavidus oxalaticus]|uniref:Glycosyltransferase family 1 protein n=1 Tax=Cupriavidus oxalaticus TaxID=96344 RepID=A0A5P3VQ80_9BURK|nr:glycosyltransferase family 4 protein [Cupriavidus oxalaticus]QEZ47542.1 glycosyltransferase family 1 protein [Cupriavidus oxalaticus]